jgi:hypothetical protein
MEFTHGWLFHPPPQSRNHAVPARRFVPAEIRVAAARSERNIPTPTHPNNGDEALYQTKIGNYSKGLPHNERGEIVPAAYQSLLTALSSGNVADFDQIQIGAVRRRNQALRPVE